jgi:flagellar basal body-associated protein FliL
MLRNLDKKSLIYLIIVFITSFLAAGLIWYFSKIPPLPKEEKIAPVKSEKEKIIEQQLKELDQLRTETATPTEKEIQEQLKELEKLRQKTKSLSQEEIQKQLEGLNKLKSQ